MTAAGFAHLHVHTEYSMLDGAAKLKALFGEVQRLGMPAVAMTDHGNMFGAYAFHQAARASGVKPVIGIEAYVAPASRFDRRPVRWGGAGDKADDVSGGGAYTHLTMLAVDGEGLRNLFRLSSLASIEGSYQKPRMDVELMAQHSSGVVVTTGCPSGAVQTRLRLGQRAEAEQAAGQLRDVFGQDNVFVEVMDHGNAIERRVREDLLDLGRRLGLPPLATNDSHYVTEDQAPVQEALLCLQTGSTLNDANRFKFDGHGYHLRSPADMRALFDGEVPGACDNTLLVAERVQPYDEVFAELSRMPEFDVPAGESQMSWLVKETWAGLARRFPGGLPEEYRRRAEYELSIIESMGFPAYFLVVSDLVRFAKRSAIRIAPGRGSATGCLVAYAIDITELDPIEHGLVFERFLNPERVSMPDIDLDIDDRRRGDMIRYITDKYGAERVCQIITFGTIGTKAAIKDAARVLGYPFALSDQVTKALPPAVMGKDIPLAGVVDDAHPRWAEAAELRRLIAESAEVARIFDLARGLEGLIRQPGVHAAAVVLSNTPLLDVIPVWRRDDGAIISGFDYPSCEAMGLLKMDFLGLRNLSVIDVAIGHVRRLHDPGFDVSAARLEDDKTYAMLARGDTLGVFQLDGGPMRDLLRSMAPTCFVDIAAVLALYRPGPMAANAHIDYADRKNGRKPVVPIHPEFAESLADILEPTYGLIVFQEQVLAIAQRVAGYSLGKADMLRRAMGKKKKEILDKEFEGFSAGMKANGYSDDAIQTLWDILLPFAGYAFNKSHTAGYGVISFWTAYLKANYPTEYMAALLTSVGDDPKRMPVYLAECRRMGIKVLPPDVNTSDGTFTPTAGGEIRFGLTAVRNVGQPVVDAVLAGRAGGPYVDFYDFLTRVGAAACNKKAVESLAKAGAFDSLGHSRRALIEVHADAVDAAAATKKKEAEGQFDLFGQMAAGGGAVVMPPIGDRVWPRRVQLAFEREMLGLYVSDHPLAGAEGILRRHSEQSIVDLDELPDGAPVVVAGLVASLERRVTKQGKPWAVAVVEDLDASVEVLLFPSVWELVAGDLAEDMVIAVRGRVGRRDNGAYSVKATDVAKIEIADSDLGADLPLVVVIGEEQVTAPVVEDLHRIAHAHPGRSPLRLLLRSRAGEQLLRIPGVRVEPSGAMLGELKALLGAGCVQ